MNESPTHKTCILPGSRSGMDGSVPRNEGTLSSTSVRIKQKINPRSTFRTIPPTTFLAKGTMTKPRHLSPWRRVKRGTPAGRAQEIELTPTPCRQPLPRESSGIPCSSAPGSYDRSLALDQPRILWLQTSKRQNPENRQVYRNTQKPSRSFTPN